MAAGMDYQRTNCTKCGKNITHELYHHCNVVASNWTEPSREYTKLKVSIQPKLKKKNRNV